MTWKNRVLAAALAATPMLAQADTVELANGDRLNGTVQGLSGSTLTFETPYTTAEIAWTEVRTVTTEGDVVLTLEDGSRVIGPLRSAPDGTLLVDTEGTAETVRVERSAVTEIYPGSEPRPALKTSGFVNIGIKATEGNTDSESYHADAEFVARTERNRYTIGTVLNYAEDEGETTANDRRLYARYDHFVSEKWYINTNTSFLRDEFKDLNLRTTLGAGMGYQFLESDDSTLSAELGATYIREDYDEFEDDTSIAARWALDYSQALFDNGFTFFHNHEILKGVAEDNEDLLAYTRTGLRLPLAAGLSGTLQVNYDYNDNPPPGTEYADVTYLASLGYAF